MDAHVKHEVDPSEHPTDADRLLRALMQVATVYPGYWDGGRQDHAGRPSPRSEQRRS